MKLAGIGEFRKSSADLLWRIVPLLVLAVVVSIVLGQQIVQPHHRMIKMAVLAVVLAFLTRYPIIFSLYFFVLLMPFPSGVVLTSTNVILMTLIPMIWMVRSLATGERLFKRTEVDKWILIFLLAHVVSFWNVETRQGVIDGIRVVWKQLTAVAFFYLIVTFVTDENKLEKMMKIVPIAGAIAASTALFELFVPGFELIPGWIEARERFGAGTLGYRVVGMRVAGAIGSYDLLSDFCAFNLWLAVPHFLRARNAIEKLLWLGVSALTITVLMATANRGALAAFALAFFYGLWVFRRYLNLRRLVIVLCAVVVVFSVTQIVLDKYTLAASVTKRFAATQFRGLTPDSRVGVWAPVFERAMEHIYIGHGPWYETSVGLTRYFWPHNGYLYYLHTIGLLGLVPFVIILYKLFRASARYAHPLASGSFLGLALSILNVQLFMFMVGQLRTDHQRNIDYIYIYIVWLFFGLIMAAHQILKGRIAEKEAAGAPADTGPAAP